MLRVSGGWRDLCEASNSTNRRSSVPIAIPLRYPRSEIHFFLIAQYLWVGDEQYFDALGAVAPGPLEFLYIVDQKFVINRSN